MRDGKHEPDDDDAGETRRATPRPVPPPQQQGKTVIDDSMFDEAMYRGIQEDLDAAAGVGFDAERAVRDLVTKG